MSRFNVDTQALKRPTFILLMVAGIAAALLWASYNYKAVRITALQQARAELGAARDEYRRTVEAGSILSTSLDRYRQLQQRGFVGAEPRLLWIESLRQTGHEHHLYNLQYNLRQRQGVELIGMDTAGHYQLYTSAMQLQLDLAHEVDLLRYFSELAQRRPAVYQLRGCTLKPLFTDTGIAFHAANVSAKCDLLWYTVDSFSVPEPTDDLL